MKNIFIGIAFSVAAWALIYLGIAYFVWDFDWILNINWESIWQRIGMVGYGITVLACISLGFEISRGV